jgi:hypothetical protein
MGASLRVLEPAIDTGGPMGRMVLTVLGMVAEMGLALSVIGSALASTPQTRRAFKVPTEEFSDGWPAMAPTDPDETRLSKLSKKILGTPHS